MAKKAKPHEFEINLSDEARKTPNLFADFNRTLSKLSQEASRGRLNKKLVLNMASITKRMQNKGHKYKGFPWHDPQNFYEFWDAMKAAKQGYTFSQSKMPRGLPLASSPLASACQEDADDFSASRSSYWYFRDDGGRVMGYDDPPSELDEIKAEIERSGAKSWTGFIRPRKEARFITGKFKKVIDLPAEGWMWIDAISTIDWQQIRHTPAGGHSNAEVKSFHSFNITVIIMIGGNYVPTPWQFIGGQGWYLTENAQRFKQITPTEYIEAPYSYRDKDGINCDGDWSGEFCYGTTTIATPGPSRSENECYGVGSSCSTNIPWQFRFFSRGPGKIEFNERIRYDCSETGTPFFPARFDFSGNFAPLCWNLWLDDA
jgi:hypothetical protein